MANVQESWSGRRYQRGKSAQRVFTVSFSTTENVTEDAARVALANAYGIQAMAQHPQDFRLTAQEPSVQLDGPFFASVTVSYVRAELQQQQEEENPLDAPPIISWQIGTYSEAVDADIDGNPLANSVGDIFDGLQNEYYTTTLTVTRNESTYDINQALAYTGATNSDAFAVPGPAGGTYTVSPLWALCRGIIPASTYTTDSLYVPVSRIIEIRTPITDFEKGGEISLFDWRILDQGLNGRFTNSTAANQIGRIVNRNGEPLTEPVRFNGDGVPIANATEKLRVDQKGMARFVDQAPPEGAKLERVAGKACFLWFKRVRRVSFAGIGL